jgi:hypothetical protein
MLLFGMYEKQGKENSERIDIKSSMHLFSEMNLSFTKLIEDPPSK